MMQAIDNDVLNQVKGALQEERTVFLCSVIKTYGAASRPVGSLFAYDGENKLGYISGDYLEEELIAKFSNEAFSVFPHRHTYSKQIPEGVVFSGPVCCGTVELLIEKLLPSKQSIVQCDLWLQMLEKREAFERVIDLQTGETRLEPLTIRSEREVLFSDDAVHLYYKQVKRMLIVGISQVSLCLARLAKMSEYSVQVCDTREELSSAWDFNETQGGVNVIWQDPSSFVKHYADENSAVVALAHCPNVDDGALVSALHSKAFYIGAIGSRNNASKRIKRFEAMPSLKGCDVKRLHGPVGLNIGSKTPMEIAISIMAEVISTQQKCAA